MYSTRGFDGIIDNAPFAGGTASFWNLRGLNRTRAERIRSSFVNPAVLLLNTGVDSDLTPKLRMSINGNVVTLPGGRGSGLDTGVGLRWRPLLNNNVVVNAGLAKMFPTESLRMMFASKPLVSSLVELRLTY